MTRPHPSAQPLTRRERRAAKMTTIRPVQDGEFNPGLGIPPGSMVIVTELALGIRHKRIVFPDGGD